MQVVAGGISRAAHCPDGLPGGHGIPGRNGGRAIEVGVQGGVTVALRAVSVIQNHIVAQTVIVPGRQNGSARSGQHRGFSGGGVIHTAMEVGTKATGNIVVLGQGKHKLRYKAAR